MQMLFEKIEQNAILSVNGVYVALILYISTCILCEHDGQESMLFNIYL